MAATVGVTHGIGDLAGDLAAIPPKVMAGGARAVRKNTAAGNSLARRYAQELSGPHGKNYHKRITWEMLGALEGEYGPHAGGVPVGGGWRHGAPNTELERSLDVVGPKFAKDIGAVVDEAFW